MSTIGLDMADVDVVWHCQQKILNDSKYRLLKSKATALTTVPTTGGRDHTAARVGRPHVLRVVRHTTYILSDVCICSKKYNRLEQSHVDTKSKLQTLRLIYRWDGAALWPDSLMQCD